MCTPGCPGCVWVEHVQAGEFEWPLPGQLTSLELRPADDRSSYLVVAWYRPRRRLDFVQSCGSWPGWRPVHLGRGLTGYLIARSAGRHFEQWLCVPDDAWRRHAVVFIDLNPVARASAGTTTGPGAAAASRFSSAVAVFKDLQFPPGGTT